MRQRRCDCPRRGHGAAFLLLELGAGASAGFLASSGNSLVGPDQVPQPGGRAGLAAALAQQSSASSGPASRLIDQAGPLRRRRFTVRGLARAMRLVGPGGCPCLPNVAQTAGQGLFLLVRARPTPRGVTDITQDMRLLIEEERQPAGIGNV